MTKRAMLCTSLPKVPGLWVYVLMLALAMLMPLNVLMKCVTGWVTPQSPFKENNNNILTLFFWKMWRCLILIHNLSDALWNWRSFSFVKYIQLSHPVIHSPGQEWLFYSSRLEGVSSAHCVPLLLHRSLPSICGMIALVNLWELSVREREQREHH